MSYTPDEKCTSYMKVCTGKMPYSWYSDFKGTLSHSVDHKYTANFFGVSVPLLSTTRSFKADWNREITTRYPLGDKIDGTNCMWLSCIDPNPLDHFTSSIAEDCVIEKSTLCYLDHRSKVLLYRYEKQMVKFNKSSTDGCWWRTAYDALGTSKLTLYKNDVSASRMLQWRLILDGSETVLYTETDNTLQPFGECFSVKRSDGQMTDPDIVQIFSLPQPPSQATAYDLDLKALEGYNNGLYDYGNLPGEESELNKEDGGNKDMFYPKWCRGLHTDPIWREIADNRYSITWFHNDLVTNKVWYPPEISADPIPKGNHVSYLDAGNFYQFILPKLNQNEFIVKDNVGDIVSLVKQTLDENDTPYSEQFLLYPLGVK